MQNNKDLKIFALIWAFIFFIISIFPLISGGELRVWSIAISMFFLIFSFVKPSIFTRFYKIWVKFGEFLGGITSKIIMFILFFGLFTPISMVLKILRKDLLRKKMKPTDESYWIERETQPTSMKNQF